MAQGNAWFASNHDDRVGCVVLAQLLRELKGAAIAHDLYAVFTTQEEVGLRGATTAAYAADPEIGIALDVTLTGDLPYATPAMEVALGKGRGDQGARFRHDRPYRFESAADGRG